MHQIHIKEFVTTSLLFLCLLLLSSAAFSKPVDSTKFINLRPPLTATNSTLSVPTPTDTPESPVDVPVPPEVEDATSKINGMAVFWIIMPLSVACMTHPIGTSCGLDQAYRHRIRIGPLISLFDTLHLLYEIHHRWGNPEVSSGAISRIHDATRVVVEARLKSNMGKQHHNDSNPEGKKQTLTLLCRIENRFHNTPIRHLFSAVLVLQYAKLCGFHGIPMSFSLGTVYFTSWVTMEIILLVGGAHRAPEPCQAALPSPATEMISLASDGHSEIEPSHAAPSESEPSPRHSILSLVGRGVFFLQSVTTLVGVSMLLWKAQTDFKFMPKHGETAPSFDLRFAAFLIISSSLMYCADSMPLFVGIYLMSGLYVPGHKNSRGVSDLIGLLMAVAYVAIITTVFYSGWVFGAAHLPFVAYTSFFYASRLFWPRKGGEVKQKGCPTMLQLQSVLTFGSSALTLAGGLLFFYVFIFNPEGTSKASWTEYFP